MNAEVEGCTNRMRRANSTLHLDTKINGMNRIFRIQRANNIFQIKKKSSNLGEIQANRLPES